MVAHHPPALRPRIERKTVFADERWKTHMNIIPHNTIKHNAIYSNRAEENHEY